MRWHAHVAGAARICVGLALVALLQAPSLGAQVPMDDPLLPRVSLGDRTSFGLTAGLAIPRGEFSEFAGVGLEVVGHVLFVNQARWLGLRLSGAGALYRAVDLPVLGQGRYSAGSRMVTLDIGPQVIAPRGAVRPYGYASLGGTFALTSLSMDQTANPLAQPASYSDVAHVVKVGGGLYIPVSAGERPVSLDLGAHFRRNGNTRFVGADDIAFTSPGVSTVDPIYISAELLVLSMGVAVGL